MTLASRCAGVGLLIFVTGCGDSSAGLGGKVPTIPKVHIAIESAAAPTVGDTIRLRATVENTAAGTVLAYRWTASPPVGTTLTKTIRNDARFEFTSRDPGTHVFTCAVDVAGTTRSKTVRVTVASRPGTSNAVYTARIIAPPALGLPPRDVTLVDPNADLSGLRWIVDEGRPVTFSVTRAGKLTPTFVRLSRDATDPSPRGVHLATGRATVRVAGRFHVLFIPDAVDVAPTLFANRSAGTLPATWAVSLDSSASSVSGVVVDAASKPLVNTVVTVATKDASGIWVPSTVGRTDTTGAFSVSTRPGAARVVIAPASGSSALGSATVESAGLAVTATTTGWRFRYAAATAIPLGATIVTRSDGRTPARAARVTIASRAQSKAGTLTAGSKQYVATARLRRELIADALGRLVDAKAPSTPVVLAAGTYDVTVRPGAGAPATEGRAQLVVSVTAAKALSLALAPRVLVKGTVRTTAGSGPSKASVVAITDDGRFTTETDDNGDFALRLDDRATYQLVFRPVFSSSRSGTVIRSKVAVAGNTVLTDVTLPRARMLGGQVTTSGGAAIGGALIRVWCSSGCASTRVLDEAQTDTSGAFRLRVPIR